VWDAVADRWTSLPHAPALMELGSPAVWTGTELLVWGPPTLPSQIQGATVPNAPAVGLRFGG
jgi:hypothetical protein